MMNMTTGTITTYDTTGGIAGLAIRAGHALEDWGRRAATPPTRDELARKLAIEREARSAIADRARATQLLH
jgi:hypothetical protein